MNKSLLMNCSQDLLTLEADPAAPANAINMTKQFLQDPNPAYRPLAARFKTFPSIDEGIDLIKKVRKGEGKNLVFFQVYRRLVSVEENKR